MKTEFTQGVLDEVNVLLECLFDFLFTMFYQVNFRANNSRGNKNIGYKNALGKVDLLAKIIHHILIVLYASIVI